MKRILITAIALSFAFAANPVLAEFKKVKSEKDFRAMVVDKKLMDANGNWTVIKADGSQDGKFGGNKYVGSWKWQGKYWCRNGVIGGKELGTDCQLVEIDGNTTRFTRNKGKGKVGEIYSIN